MIKTPLFLLTTASLAFGVDAFSSIEDLFGKRRYDPNSFSERNLTEEKRFAPFSPGDSDLGDQLILARTTGRTPVRLDLSTSVYWSNNLASSAANRESGFFWENRAEVSWRPRIGDNLFFDSFLEVDTYLFDSKQDLDFQSYTLGLGAVKIMHSWDDLLLYARYEFQHLNSTGRTLGGMAIQDADYHMIRYGAHKVFLSEPQHTAYIALDFRHDLDTDPGALARNEYALRLGYTYHATDDLKALVYYRLAYRDFQDVNREDVNQIFGTELNYYLTRNFILYASALWANNDSNFTGVNRDYHSTQVGIGLSYQKEF